MRSCLDTKIRVSFSPQRVEDAWDAFLDMCTHPSHFGLKNIHVAVHVSIVGSQIHDMSSIEVLKTVHAWLSSHTHSNLSSSDASLRKSETPELKVS